MTTDIYSSSPSNPSNQVGSGSGVATPANAIDLVIFTVVDESTIRSKVWDEDLISPKDVGTPGHTGLSLFVVTVPVDGSRYPGLSGRRILPGGFLRPDETLADAARRIADERLGLSFRTKIRQLGTFDDPNRDPNGRVLSFAYWAMVDFEDIRKFLGGRDRVGLELVNATSYMRDFEIDNGPLENFDGVCRFGNRAMPSPSLTRGHFKTLTNAMPSGRLLGLDHDDMVFYAWRALRHAFDGKLDPFTFLGLNPLGEEFRLSELHEFTEVCRGERIQRDLFRRRMLSESSKFVVESGNTDNKRPGKPATMYRAKPLSDG